LGVLYLPTQFDSTGVVAMPTIMAASLLMVIYCTKLMIECADQYGNSFTEIAEAAFGKTGKLIT